MSVRERALRLAAVVFGGVTAVAAVVMAVELGLAGDTPRDEGVMLAMVLLCGPVMLTLLAWLAGMARHEGYRDALRRTAGAFGHGALLGLAVLALTILMWSLAEHIWRHVIWWNFY